ncbi:MAG: hypothetical protein ACKOEW_03840 [Methylocystis sp.]
MEPIPFVDVRQGGPMAHVKSRIATAHALRDACLAPVPSWGRGILAPIDHLAGAWLKKSASHYREELETIAEYLGFPGAMTLNLSYLFACTTAAEVDRSGRPRIRRSLDWPFHGLGKCVEVAWQSGPAGCFHNVKWPGSVGVLSAMAPGRFAAVINAAPMQRRTKGAWGLPYDVALNIRQALARAGNWPPDHLLRYVFENCSDFEEAIVVLSQEPLARSALFTITGVHSDQIAVVERTETKARVIRGPVAVANDWQKPEQGWKARMGHDNNVARREAMLETKNNDVPFIWAQPPVVNKLTRLLVEMSATNDGVLHARGYESGSVFKMAIPATLDFSLRHTKKEPLAA